MHHKMEVKWKLPLYTVRHMDKKPSNRYMLLASSCQFNPWASLWGHFQSDFCVSEVQPPWLFLSTWYGSSTGKTSGAALTQRNTNLFSLNRRRAAAHLLRHNRDNTDDDGGHYEDAVWGQVGENHICRVVVGRRGGRDGWLFECCHYVKASPGCPCTLTPVAKSWRPRQSGRSVCLLLLKGSVSRIQGTALLDRHLV